MRRRTRESVLLHTQHRGEEGEGGREDKSACCSALLGKVLGAGVSGGRGRRRCHFLCNATAMCRTLPQSSDLVDQVYAHNRESCQFEYSWNSNCTSLAVLIACRISCQQKCVFMLGGSLFQCQDLRSCFAGSCSQ